MLPPVDGGAEGERGDRSDAGRAHQSPTAGLLAHDVEYLLGQAGELLEHGVEDRKQRLDHCHRLGIGQYAHATSKVVRDGVPSLMPASRSMARSQRTKP